MPSQGLLENLLENSVLSPYTSQPVDSPCIVPTHAVCHGINPNFGSGPHLCRNGWELGLCTLRLSVMFTSYNTHKEGYMKKPVTEIHSPPSITVVGIVSRVALAPVVCRQQAAYLQIHLAQCRGCQARVLRGGRGQEVL